MVRVSLPSSGRSDRSDRSDRSPAAQDSNGSSPGHRILRADFVVFPATILFDDRERTGGWRFQNIIGSREETNGRPWLVKQREVHLVTADYTLEAADGTRLPCYIERKSHDDCIGSVTRGHERLRAEHERMQEIIRDGGFCCVIVESSLDRLLDDLELTDRERMAETLLGVAASWPQQYGVPWYFAGSRRAAERIGLRVFSKFLEQRNEGG